jgi:hypothetical protein
VIDLRAISEMRVIPRVLAIMRPLEYEWKRLGVDTFGGNLRHRTLAIPRTPPTPAPIERMRQDDWASGQTGATADSRRTNTGSITVFAAGESVRR